MPPPNRPPTASNTSPHLEYNRKEKNCEATIRAYPGHWRTNHVKEKLQAQHSCNPWFYRKVGKIIDKPELNP